ncbi:tryptophan 7-halogenase [Actinophytocola glycyrrhizae]|uniref:Tryptophan 7-halogenase n=1 Tax=Actinophytocola glycyrrhizae TaxID=2044873 RepID=A0ABV9S5M3_9PSEU
MSTIADVNDDVKSDYDVIVVGGGPGGSTVAGLVAMDGHHVLLLEKETFPRYQIGESLLPATVHGVCALLGVRDEIERAGFVRKRGGTFRWGSNREPWTFSFAASERMAGPTSYAYQVERGQFDTILLDNAKRLGADVRQGHRVVGTVRNDDRVAGVRYVDDRGGEHIARARFVVDASGHGSRLHRDVDGEREYSPHFRNLALFGYFEGGHRMPAPNSGNILCAAFPDGWFWYIPLSDTLTSVGAVVRHSAAARVRGDLDAAYAGLIADCPLVAELLADASRATEPPYDELRVRKDYSYDRTALWCPGMVLVGDAACFIDPVFSSGVHLATYSGLLAARSINSALAGELPEERAFTEFELRYRREFTLFHDFLVAFYETSTDEQGYFTAASKLTGRAGTDPDAGFVDLVGGVSSTDFSRRLTGEVLAEGARLQVRGLLGEAAGAEPPLFPGGLVPSPDGRRWLMPGV